MNKFTCAFSFCCGILLGIGALILLCGCSANALSSGRSSRYHGGACSHQTIALVSPPPGGFDRLQPPLPAHPLRG